MEKGNLPRLLVFFDAVFPKGGFLTAAYIKGVEAGSLAEAHGITAGSTLLKINGHEIVDVLDYRFFMVDEQLQVVYKTPQGKLRMVRIDKDEYDDLGIEFETYLIDKQHSCKNKCIFCFIDQLPKGMRESLYFKDDDSRMSFFYGNYITLTNLNDADIERIIKMHISPVNVSVHTMNPQLRCFMMNNRFAGDSLRYLKVLAEAGININTQLVLCPGINDGEELEYSIRQLAALGPSVQSIACVPVGLTKHREGLPEIKGYTRLQARKVVEMVDRLALEMFIKHGRRLCYAADEFYILADMPIPDEEYYEDYPQLDNGVGLMRLFETEVNEALADEKFRRIEYPSRVTIATGNAAAPFIDRMAKKVTALYGGKFDVRVKAIENVFFGDSITVAGLLTGEDIIRQLKGRRLGSALFLPKVALRSGETVLLDDVSVEDISRELGVPVVVVDNDGAEFVEKLMEKAEEVE